MSGSVSIASGQTVTATGDIRGMVTLGSDSTLEIASGNEASLFGAVSAGANATIVVEAGAILFVPAGLPSTVSVILAGEGSELVASASTLPKLNATLSAVSPGAVFDISGADVTSVTTSDLGGGRYAMAIGTSQGSLGYLNVDAAPPPVLLAIPDGIDGSLILGGDAFAAPSQAPAGMTNTPATYVWADGSGGSWSSVDGWQVAGATPGQAPGLQDSVVLAGDKTAWLTMAGVGEAATIFTSGAVALAGPLTAGTMVIGAAFTDALVLAPGAQVATGAASVRAGVLSVQDGTLSVSGALSVFSTLDEQSGAVVTAASLSLDGGSIRLADDSSLLVGGGLMSAGALTIASGSTVQATGTLHANVELNGRLVIPSGTLSVFGAITGSGTIQLDSHATIFLSAEPGLATIDFASGAGATVELFDEPSDALLANFDQSDSIDIAELSAGTLTWSPVASGGTIDLGIVGNISLDLAPGLDPAFVQFVQRDDGHGGTAITVIPCFTETVRLRTPAGWINVAEVTPRTWLFTAAGAARRAVWVGRTLIPGWRRRAEPQLDPVVIRANAFGLKVPASDVTVSPQHGILFETPTGFRIVPAVALVDGDRVVRAREDGAIAYLHVATDRHDAVVASGLATETFFPAQPEPKSLFGSSVGKQPRSGIIRAKRLEAGPALRGLRGKLRLWGMTTGHTHPGQHVDDSVESHQSWLLNGWAAGVKSFEVLADGISVAHAEPDEWRADLEAAQINDGFAAFRVRIPRLGPQIRLSLRPSQSPSRGRSDIRSGHWRANVLTLV